MLKKTITFKDFNDEEVSEDHYFHLSKAELIELEMSVHGGFSDWMKAVVAAEDGTTIMTEFKKIILSSYGVRSEDGRRFIKNQDLREMFESSEAYSSLFVELVTDADAAAEFISGIIPTDMAKEAASLGLIEGKSEPTPLIAVKDDPELVSKADYDQLSQEERDKIFERVVRGEVKLTD